MGELGTQINKMLERIKELMEDNLNREMLAKNSEIRALQNQINAHFIYNPIFDSWKAKNGCKASKINACNRFLFRSDMCYCAIFFTLG